MSLSMGLVGVRGSYVTKPDELFRFFDVELAANASQSLSWDAATGLLSDVNKKAIGEVTGWTVILDPELVLPENQEALLRLSKEQNTTVVGAICQGTSGTYMIVLVEAGSLCRSVLSVDGEVLEDEGAPLEGESAQGQAGLDEDIVLRILASFGIDFWRLNECTQWTVVSPVDSLATSSSLSNSRVAAGNSPKRPWWQFWRS